jgi:UDP-N-acetylmuramoyl-tripeptide--D-alanyl-D-alanine ligase
MLFFQQKEYVAKWFLKFIFKGGARLVDKKLTFLLFMLWLFFPLTIYYVSVVPIFFVCFGIKEAYFLKNAKKKLVMTQRVKRILLVAYVLTIVLAFALSRISSFLYVIITIQLLPILIVVGNCLLSPIEKNIQKKFLNEAKEKLEKIKPVVIGITGSFGKTSTKHILAHVLSGNLSVLFTPRSVNTEMGITRVIRENLMEQHKYFVVEMGAYFKGSIAKLCKFVNPKHGIITAVGEAHYEYFKTRETVASAKFELGEWVTKNNGTLIVNNSQIEDRLIPKNMPMIKVGNGTGVYATDINQMNDKLSFTLCRNGEKYQVVAPIYGLHQVNNIVLAIEMSLRLGMDMDTILAKLHSLPQINHRLEALKQDGNIMIIDDAFNSNFEGFKSGLELLQSLQAGRRILITPGMVELGKLHNSMHYEIGKIAGKKVDVALVVAANRIPTFLKGFKETASEGTLLMQVKSFSDAKDWTKTNLRAGDVVLLENDLPDVYESEFRL